MRVVVETFEESFTHVLVDVRVVRDLTFPVRCLGRVRQLAVIEQVRHLDVGGFLGQLLDGIAAVAQDAGLTVEIRDGGFARGGDHERRVVEPHTGHDLGEVLGGDAPVLDRNLERLTSAVVGHGNGLGHGSSVQLGGRTIVCQLAGKPKNQEFPEGETMTK